MNDYLLPDEKTIDLMNTAYKNVGIKNASIFAHEDAHIAPLAPVHASFVQSTFLILYIARFLRYNNCYGTEIYDPYRSVGRIQPKRSPFGIVNNLK